MEHHLALEGGGGVVEVENHVFGAFDGVKGLFDEVLPGLYQHLDGHIVGDVAALDQLPADLIFRLAGGREADLDLLHTDVDEGVEVLQLFLEVHGIHQGLVAVPQVHRAPHRSFGNNPVRPGAVFNGLGLEGNVLLVTGFQVHSKSSFGSSGGEKTPPTKSSGA